MKSDVATIHFNQQGTPIATDFDDVYFSNDSGIDETQYVFIEANRLHERWQNHPDKTYVIAETGFGTGLNCLVAIAQFAQFREQHPTHPLQHLYILTTEKYPVPPQQIAQALQGFTSLSPVLTEMLRHYPEPAGGCHRMCLNQYHTTIDLWIGDVNDSMPQWHVPQQGLVDSWFLDGFAPSKNPAMWSSELFNNMARVSKYNASFATFTAAGIVKRGLAEAGFTVRKYPGFGRKRDMLVGELSTVPAVRSKTPWYSRLHQQHITPTDTVGIIGGGIAAALMAYKLTQRGIRAEIICQAPTLADGASGNPQGGFYPQLHAEASIGSQFQLAAFLYARNFYAQLIEQELAFAHDFCGVLQLSFSEEVTKRQQQLLDNDVWPKHVVQGVDAAQASEISGLELPYSALFLPLGGWISPPQLVEQLVKAAQQTGLLTLRLQQRCIGYMEHENDIEVRLETQEAVRYQHLVIASGFDHKLLPALDDIPLRPVRGQVEAIPSNPTLSKLNTVICHKGYFTPAYDGRHALGSTYNKLRFDSQPDQQESEQNLATHRKAMAACDWLSALEHDFQARASVRLSTPDHQPLMGAVPDIAEHASLYLPLGKGQQVNHLPPSSARISMLTALGSRGLTTAPLLAETLASQLSGDPLPMADRLLAAVNPNRFIVRQCQRNQI